MFWDGSKLELRFWRRCGDVQMVIKPGKAHIIPPMPTGKIMWLHYKPYLTVISEHRCETNTWNLKKKSLYILLFQIRHKTKHCIPYQIKSFLIYIHVCVCVCCTSDLTSGSKHVDTPKRFTSKWWISLGKMFCFFLNVQLKRNTKMKTANKAVIYSQNQKKSHRIAPNHLHLRYTVDVKDVTFRPNHTPTRNLV